MSSNTVEFTKCVIKKGSLRVPQESQWVTLKLKKLFNPDVISALGHEFDSVIGFRNSSIDQLEPDEESVTCARIRLGYFETEMGEIVDRAVAEMRLGECAQVSFEIDPKALDESLDDNDQKSTVFIDVKFQIVLVEIEDGPDGKEARPLYQLDENELYERALEHKNDANRIFKLGRLRTAFKRYKKAMDLLIIADQQAKEKAKTLDQLPEDLDPTKLENCRRNILATKSQLYSNLALCQLKMKRFELVVKNCDKCLSIDSNNVKALFRRGHAQMALKEYEKAIGDLKKALEIEPDNHEVRLCLSNCEKLKKNYERELAANLKKLFD